MESGIAIRGLLPIDTGEIRSQGSFELLPRKERFIDSITGMKLLLAGPRAEAREYAVRQ